MNITIETKQLKDLSKKLENAGAKTIKMSELELEASANDVLRIAKVLAPVDLGALRGNMAMQPITKNQYEIGNNKDYAPYVEFGTGANVSAPAEWKAFAMQFKSATKEFSSLRNGQHAQPFLYPAYKEGQKLLIKRIINVIKDFKLK